ncbi:alpha/beta hydrolase [Aldersonia sp. NBC_00410]|uniref:alpha/beta-hydrolase family protein n=1 Tax=Aldersonia sp. NBC_00410 TaxID=2975954 RepID=UPI0022538B59|nr:alpha/beta-hydrolase family protein [Aldersonia sp. NBC_00410]MCX5046112.1 alpha/beta hydrolase [Aldersonia sp. NBC_00410]
MSAAIDLPTAVRFRARSVAAPRIATTVALTLAGSVALSPALLPRSAAIQAALTGLLLALGMLGAKLWKALRPSTERSSSATSLAVAAGGAVLIGSFVLRAHHWQNDLRTAMGASRIGPDYWVLVLAGGVAVAAALAGTAQLVGAGLRRARARPRLAALAVSACATACLAVPATPPQLAHASAVDSSVDRTVARPASPARSGGPDSLTPWESLGTHGRRFVAAPAPDSVVRTYVGLASAPDPDARVRLAIRELDRAGGFGRSNMVVTVPTGSGWIDADAVAGLERRFDGDVAEVAVQYSAAPSWATFVFDRNSATESSARLYAAVTEHVSRLAPDRRPRVYLYGQSLGAIGVAAAAAQPRPAPCGAMYAGPPAGTSTVTGAVLANASDPVVWWSPRLLVRPPRLDAARPDAPRPRWLPVVTFLQTSVDLLSALNMPTGHGHRYGADQGTAMPGCTH